jgi:hypothetical protein
MLRDITKFSSVYITEIPKDKCKIRRAEGKGEESSETYL